MSGYRHMAAAKFAGCVASAVFVVLTVVVADTVHAQQTTPGTTTQGSPDPFRDMRERRQREAQLRSVETRLRESARRRGVAAEAALKQVNEDFARIQVLHNEIVRDLSAHSVPDRRLVAEAAAEIHKRAMRLKKFLLPDGLEATPKETPKEMKEQRAEPTDDQMRDALVKLCRRIENFVENPMFNASGVVDVEQSARAGSDLLRIIQLSDSIKRESSK